MNGIGMVLGLQAEAVEAVIARAAFAFVRRGMCGGVELHARLIGEDLHHAPGLGLNHLCGEDGLCLRFLGENEGVIVAADGDLSEAAANDFALGEIKCGARDGQ